MAVRFNTILLPVESQVRELDAKILFACAAAESGFEVIIGSRAYIHYYASRIKNCVYVAKSMRRFSDRMFRILHGLGHRVVAWDEEALVRLPDQEYYTHRLSPNTFKYIEHLFAWGSDDACTYKKYDAYDQHNIHIVGNPRIDMLRPEIRDYFQDKVNIITEKYGDFLLVNTNFGQVNHYISTVGKSEAVRDQSYAKTSNSQFMTQRFNYKNSLFNYFKKMVILLAQAFPELNIVVRPHPSESLHTWQEHTKGYENVHTDNSDNVIPWIMASKALISNGCTTSIESFILNKPSIGYYPLSNSDVEDPLPKLVNVIARDIDELISIVSNTLNNPYHPDMDKTSKLSEHIENLSGDYAIDRICEVLARQYLQPTSKQVRVSTQFISVMHNELRTVVKHIKKFNQASRNSTLYQKHRFPDIDDHYIEERISSFSQLLHRFEGIKVKPVKNNLFKIYTQ